MATLYGSLNEDVFINILQCLSKKDLISVCLASRAVHSIAERFLYHTIEWEWTTTTKPPIVVFLETIMRRPDLGKHVRILNLTSENRIRPASDNTKPDPQLVAKTLATLTLPFVDRWRTAISKGQLDALLALLLLHTPLLTQLRLERAWSRNSYWLCCVLAAGLDGHDHVPCFGNLQVVSHQRHYRERPLPDVDINIGLISFFYLPAIRRLSVAFDYPLKISWPIGTPPCTKLVDLTIGNVREVQLYSLLLATPNVKRLEWYINHDYETTTNTNLLDLGAIMKALKLLQHQLEALTVRLWFGPEDNLVSEMQTIGSIKGLSEFEALKDIHVPMLFLDDFHQDEDFDFHSVMTVATERLILRDDLYMQLNWAINDNELVNNLELMLKDWPERYPHLQSIVFRIDEYEPSWNAWHKAIERIHGLQEPRITVDLPRCHV